LRLEWGFPVAHETITESGDSRFHFSLDFEDRLPEEIERIQRLKEENNIASWAWRFLDEEFRTPKSPLREKLHRYFASGQLSYSEGNFEEAKSYYEKVVQTKESVYQQAKDYVKGCLEHERELREYGKVALQFYREGQPERAKEIWEKIVIEAKIRSFILEL